MQIYWHEKQPIYSLSYDLEGRLATAGGDNMIRVKNSVVVVVYIYLLNSCYLDLEDNISSTEYAWP
jgi:hypothetical protein